MRTLTKQHVELYISLHCLKRQEANGIGRLSNFLFELSSYDIIAIYTSMFPKKLSLGRLKKPNDQDNPIE